MAVLGKLVHIKAKVGRTWWIEQGQFALIDAWTRIDVPIWDIYLVRRGNDIID